MSELAARDWELFTHDVAALRAAGRGQDAFLRLGQMASRCAPTAADAPADDGPPAWLTRDVDGSPIGGPARAAWLMTAFAVVGSELGLRADQVELALARARSAAALSRTTLRQHAAGFTRERQGAPVEALLELLLERARAAARAVDGPAAAQAFTELLALYPEAVASSSWLGLEMAAIDAVSAQMHRRDEPGAAALVAALSGVIDRQPEAVRQRALGLRSLRGAFQVWRAEARFGTERHDEAVAALDAADGVYAQLPEVRDLPRAQIPRLRGHHARRVGQPERAAALFAEALAYLTERYDGPRAMVLACVRDLTDASLAAGRLDDAEAALLRAREVLSTPGRDAVTGVRGEVAIELARLAIARCDAGQRGAARERLTDLHGQVASAPALDVDAAALLLLLGQLHERLGEHAAARGCHATGLSRLGERRGEHGDLYLRLTLQHANALFNTRSLGALEDALRGERAALLAPGAARLRELAGALAARPAPPVLALRTAGVPVVTSALPPAAGTGSGAAPVRRPPVQRLAPLDWATQDPMGLAEPWLKPISDAAPAGVDATYDARYVTVTAWLTELDSPASGRLDRARVWGSVEAAGRELLVEVTKDLTMAAYVAHAMYQLQGAIGLVRGLALFTGLVERFWPAMFPEVKRVKRRANALAWYVERTAAALEAAPPTAGERDALERALTLLDRLIASTRERMGDATPPFAPLRDALRRRALDAARGA
jgi:hypothetical protein